MIPVIEKKEIDGVEMSKIKITDGIETISIWVAEKDRYSFDDMFQRNVRLEAKKNAEEEIKKAVYKVVDKILL